MEVVFRTNLGSRDAAELGLDHTECVIGGKVTVKEATYDKLVERGLVEPVEKPPKPKPKKVQAVPPAAAIARPKDTTTKTDE